MIKKNDEIIVDIVDNGFQGEGIAKVDGLIIFIPNAIKNEKIKIKILKVNSHQAYGKILEIIEKDSSRIQPDCQTYNKCGGCAMRHMTYDKTIDMKKNSVYNTLKKALGREVIINDILTMDKPYFYRNKLQYPIGVGDDGKPTMGVFQERTHKIIPTKNCLIQDKLSQQIANDIYKFIKDNNIEVYNERTLKGSIRHIIIRVGKKTGKIMVILVSNERKIKNEDKLVQTLTEKYKEIETIVKNINSKNTNVILGYNEETTILYGKGYIEDYLGDYKFKISPMSFYQVNPIQTEKLYSKAIEYAQMDNNESTIFDLYCGIGTIGIFASQKAKKIYGIETVKEAIKDARENAKLNNIQNAEYFVGDVENKLPELIKEKNIKADVIFVDPPRKGCDKTALETIIKISPNKVVYVSCNPATLGRDLKILEEEYDINKIAICDMFPFTHHIECIVLLEKK